VGNLLSDILRSGENREICSVLNVAYPNSLTRYRQSIQKHPQSNVLVVLPRKRSAKECAAFLKTFVNGLGIHVDFVADSHHLVNLSKKGIHVTTSACLFAAVSRGIPRMISSLGLVLLDDLELLDDEYELAISLLLHASQEFSVRIIGMSAALSDSSDLAEWLHVPPEALYSFRPADRDQALITLTQTFTIPHSAALLKAMSKPVHDAIRASPLNETAVVFVPTRFQCRMVATELITQCAIEMDVRGFLGGNLTAEEMDSHLAPLKDRSMYDALTHGIGFFHEGMEASDRLLVLELYTDGFIRVLLTPRESCWSLPVRAGAVIVMGTQYTYASPDGGERQVKDYTLQELVRMQSLAVRHGRQGKFYLMCQAEERDTFLRFLDDGLPLESSLADSDKITVWLREQRTTHSIQTKQDIMDVLSFTYLAKRIATNPTYYNTQPGGTNEALSRIADKLWEDTPEHPVE
jgi:antiviral helicase SLH1